MEHLNRGENPSENPPSSVSWLSASYLRPESAKREMPTPHLSEEGNPPEWLQFLIGHLRSDRSVAGEAGP